MQHLAIACHGCHRLVLRLVTLENLDNSMKSNAHVTTRQEIYIKYIIYKKYKNISSLI